MKFNLFKKIVNGLDEELALICYYFYKKNLTVLNVKRMEKMTSAVLIDDTKAADYFKQLGAFYSVLYVSDTLVSTNESINLYGSISIQNHKLKSTVMCTYI